FRSRTGPDRHIRQPQGGESGDAKPRKAIGEGGPPAKDRLLARGNGSGHHRPCSCRIHGLSSGGVQFAPCDVQRKIAEEKRRKEEGKVAMKVIALGAIRFYRRFISPLKPPSCRFYPTCSECGLTAIARYGVIRGGWLTVKRIAKCHPFHPGGFDPLP